MTGPYAAPEAYAPPAPAAPRRPDPAPVRAAVSLAVALAVLGALLGLVWSAWSPPGPAAEVLGGGRFAVIDESESAVAGDGRFLVIAAATGLVAALLAWFGLRAVRGAAVLLGLAAGAAGGALLTELVGHLTGGGSFAGRLYDLSDGSRQEVTLHLPLSLHLGGLLAVEPGVVVLVYGLFVAFTAHDDLGRPDPVRELVAPPRPPVPPYGSVHPGDHPQYGGGHGDAAGPPQQGDLPPQ